MGSPSSGIPSPLGHLPMSVQSSRASRSPGVRRLAQCRRAKSATQVRSVRSLAAGCRGNFHCRPPCFRQAVDMREQKLGFVLGRTLDLPIPAGAHNQMHVRWTRGEMFVHITLAIRHAGDAVRPGRGTLPALAVVSSHRFDSLSAMTRERRGIAFPLSRFQTWASTRPSNALLPTSSAKAACNRSPPKFPPLPTGPYPLARARGPPSANSLVSWATTMSRPATRSAVSSAAWRTISSAVTEALRRKRVNCTSRDRLRPAGGYSSPAVQQGPHARRPPFFQAAVAKPPQPKLNRHRCLSRESSLATRNQTAHALRNKDVCIR